MSANMNSLNSPSGGGNGSGSNNNDRPRLTDAEKKQNHILSEQKRRQAIRQGFDRLAAMTPGMAGLGRSEAAVLAATVGEIKKQTALKAALKRKIMGENPDVTDEWFETFYARNIPVAPVVNNANNAGSQNSSQNGSQNVNQNGSQTGSQNGNQNGNQNGHNSPETTSHHSASSSSNDSEGSSSSKGKAKRVRRE